MTDANNDDQDVVALDGPPPGMPRSLNTESYQSPDSFAVRTVSPSVAFQPPMPSQASSQDTLVGEGVVPFTLDPPYAAVFAQMSEPGPATTQRGPGPRTLPPPPPPPAPTATDYHVTNDAYTPGTGGHPPPFNLPPLLLTAPPDELEHVLAALNNTGPVHPSSALVPATRMPPLPAQAPISNDVTELTFEEEIKLRAMANSMREAGCAEEMIQNTVLATRTQKAMSKLLAQNSVVPGPSTTAVASASSSTIQSLIPSKPTSGASPLPAAGTGKQIVGMTGARARAENVDIPAHSAPMCAARDQTHLPSTRALVPPTISPLNTQSSTTPTNIMSSEPTTSSSVDTPFTQESPDDQPSCPSSSQGASPSAIALGKRRREDEQEPVSTNDDRLMRGVFEFMPNPPTEQDWQATLLRYKADCKAGLHPPYHAKDVHEFPPPSLWELEDLTPNGHVHRFPVSVARVTQIAIMSMPEQRAYLNDLYLQCLNRWPLLQKYAPGPREKSEWDWKAQIRQHLTRLADGFYRVGDETTTLNQLHKGLPHAFSLALSFPQRHEIPKKTMRGGWKKKQQGREEEGAEATPFNEYGEPPTKKARVNDETVVVREAVAAPPEILEPATETPETPPTMPGQAEQPEPEEVPKYLPVPLTTDTAILLKYVHSGRCPPELLPPRVPADELPTNRWLREVQMIFPAKKAALAAIDAREKAIKQARIRRNMARIERGELILDSLYDLDHYRDGGYAPGEFCPDDEWDSFSDHSANEGDATVNSISNAADPHLTMNLPTIPSGTGVGSHHRSPEYGPFEPSPPPPIVDTKPWLRQSRIRNASKYAKDIMNFFADGDAEVGTEEFDYSNEPTVNDQFFDQRRLVDDWRRALPSHDNDARIPRNGPTAFPQVPISEALPANALRTYRASNDPTSLNMGAYPAGSAPGLSRYSVPGLYADANSPGGYTESRRPSATTLVDPTLSPHRPVGLELVESRQPRDGSTSHAVPPAARIPRSTQQIIAIDVEGNWVPEPAWGMDILDCARHAYPCLPPRPLHFDWRATARPYYG